ncbi:MAG: ChbG/HpnK family deacetylase [Burkholderiaceae bacterium]
MTPVIVNADDYGLVESVDAAIIALGRLGVVTACSAMVEPSRWPVAAAAFRGAFGTGGNGTPEIGLHLELGRSGVGLPRTLVRAYARQLERGALQGLVDRQLDRFEDEIGAAPVFVDGHEHVHQLPRVRDVLVDRLLARYRGDAMPAIRICAPSRWRGMKAALIGVLGASALRSLAGAAGLPTNSDFAGVYDFSPSADLPALWRRWVSTSAGPRPVIMCHVALPGEVAAAGDRIAGAREREFAWLSSPGFGQLLESLDARPVGWRGQGLPTRCASPVRQAP